MAKKAYIKAFFVNFDHLILKHDFGHTWGYGNAKS